MKYIIKVLSIIYVMILLFTKVLSETVNILTERPNIVNAGNWKQKYDLISEYFSKNTNLKDVNIHFGYNEREPLNKDNAAAYEDYVKFIIKQFKENKYDMMIVDGSFLFSEMSYVESNYVKKRINLREFHNKLYMDLTDEIKSENLSFHDTEILNDGYYNDRLYGLPYEVDFDLLFYHGNDTNNELLNINMDSLEWEDILQDKYKEPGTESISMAIKDEDELLNFFVEFLQSKMDLTKNENFRKLYNFESENYLNKFKEFIIKSSIQDTTVEKAYEKFHANQSTFYKGKASDIKTLEQTDSVHAVLPPHSQSIFYKKYLIINKNSKIDKNILINVAQQLVSKEMQFFKATNFGSIPTYDFSLNNVNVNDFKLNCPGQAELISKIKKIHIKNIFKSDNSAPFMEIRLFLPGILKDFINNNIDQKSLSNVFENTKEILMNKAEASSLPLYSLYIPTILFSFASLYLIYLILKHKNHPYLKIFSPDFCILIIIGIVLSIIYLVIKLEIKNVGSCKYVHIYASIFTDLTLFPMVAVTYRIYKIYRNKSKLDIGRYLNKKIVIYLILGLAAMIIYASISSFRLIQYYLDTYGTIKTYRQPVCNYETSGVFESIERRVNELIYLIMIYMVVRTGSVSKKFGEFKYVYIMFCIGIMEYTREYIITILPTNTFYQIYILIFALDMALYILLIYYLVGSRLIYVIKHPEEERKPYDLNTYAYNYYYGDFNTYNNTINTNSKVVNGHKINGKSSPLNSNKSLQQSSNTTISEMDCCYDSSNNIFNQGINYMGYNENNSPTSPNQQSFTINNSLEHTNNSGNNLAMSTNIQSPNIQSPSTSAYTNNEYVSHNSNSLLLNNTSYGSSQETYTSQNYLNNLMKNLSNNSNSNNYNANNNYNNFNTQNNH